MPSMPTVVEHSSSSATNVSGASAVTEKVSQVISSQASSTFATFSSTVDPSSLSSYTSTDVCSNANITPPLDATAMVFRLEFLE